MKKITFAFLIGSFFALNGMENSTLSIRTYTATQVQQLQFLDHWYDRRLQPLIDQYFDKEIDRGMFDAKSNKIYKKYLNRRKQILISSKTIKKRAPLFEILIAQTKINEGSVSI